MCGTNKKTAAGLAAHAAAQEGMFYWYGTFGQAPTQQLLDQKRRQYPAMYKADKYLRAKAQVGAKGKRVYDCAGLVKSYWMQESPSAPPVYRAAYDLSANELYKKCVKRGALASLPGLPGALVFIYDAKRGAMGHVGVSLGGGQVIDAANSAKGVKRDALKVRGWTHWGLLTESWLECEQDAGWKPGDRARVKPGTEEYFPGAKMAGWVPGQEFTVAQTVDAKGKEVIRGGKRCVLLKEIISWCAVDILEKV